MRTYDLFERRPRSYHTPRSDSPVVSGPPEAGEVAFPMGLSDEDFTEQIRVGEAFNETPLRTYGTASWRVAWWREAIQNSVDAGAAHVWLRYVKTGDSVYEVGVEDDGTGMDEETLLNKFLALGGSGKSTAYGATGGFGKAKELLLLPWLQWDIQSATRKGGDVEVVHIRGRGSRHARPEVRTVPLAEAQESRAAMGFPRAKPTGTYLRVWMGVDPRKPEGIDRRVQEADAEFVLERSYLPRVTFYLNGNERSASSTINRPPRGEPLRKWDVQGKDSDAGLSATVSVYAKKGETILAEEIVVRQNGLFMFVYGPRPEGINGRVTVECSGSAKLLYVDSRQKFDYPYHENVQQFVSSMEVEGEFALRPQVDPVNNVYEGEDLRREDDPVMQGIEANLRSQFESFEERARAKIERDKEANKQSDLDDNRLSPDEVLSLVTTIREMADLQRELRDPENPVDVTVDAAESESALSNLPVQANTEQFMGNLAWRPRFLVRSEWGTLTVPEEYMLGPGMTYYARCLLHFWTEICRWVCISLGTSLQDVGSGFVFDWDPDGQETLAMHLEAGSGYDFYSEMYEKKRKNVPRGRWLLLNPVIADATLKNQFDDPIAFKIRPRFRLGSRDDHLLLLSAAIHEATHLQGYHRHDVKFSYALTRNMIIMPRVMPLLSRTMKRVRELYRSIKVRRATMETRADAPGARTRRRRSGGGRDPRLPAAGSSLTRQYGDELYEAETTDTNAVILRWPTKFRYWGFPADKRGREDPGKTVALDGGVEGREYKTISALARMITGTDTNGFVFFGLT